MESEAEGGASTGGRGSEEGRRGGESERRALHFGSDLKMRIAEREREGGGGGEGGNFGDSVDEERRGRGRLACQ